MNVPQTPPREVLCEAWGAARKNYCPTLPQKALTDEFRELRATVERMGLLKANHLFFLLYLLHILLLDVAAWLILWIFGTSLVPFFLCTVLLCTVQVSAFGIPGVPRETSGQESCLGSEDTRESEKVGPGREHTFCCV